MADRRRDGKPGPPVRHLSAGIDGRAGLTTSHGMTASISGVRRANTAGAPWSGAES